MHIPQDPQNRSLRRKIHRPHPLYPLPQNDPSVSLTVIPWSCHAETHLYLLSQLSEIPLIEADIGSYPANIYEKPLTYKQFTDSDLCFFFIDSQISPENLEDFWVATERNGGFAKPFVAVVFQEFERYPWGWEFIFEELVERRKRISRKDPDWLFLLQDVEKEHVYIYEASGCFREVGTGGKRGEILGHHVFWNQLPKMKWEDLCKIRVPLRKSEIEESTPEDMEDLLFETNPITTRTTEEIEKELERYLLAKKKTLLSTPVPRPDPNNAARDLLIAVLIAGKNKAPIVDLRRKQNLLAAQHARNWYLFTKSQLSKTRLQNTETAMKRLKISSSEP